MAEGAEANQNMIRGDIDREEGFVLDSEESQGEDVGDAREMDENEPEDEDEDEKDNQGEAIQAKREEEIMTDEQKRYHLYITDIDAYWLQQKLDQFLKNPVEAQNMELSVLQILSIPDENECQNKLFNLLTQEIYSYEFV